MQMLCGKSLIGHAGTLLATMPAIDARIISTDAQHYADEGQRFGLDVLFLRPPELSGDAAGAVETTQHALTAAEKHYGGTFDIVLIIEPTSPLRRATDITAAMDLLVGSGADSVVSVSPLSAKGHPLKLLTVEEHGHLRFYADAGARIVGRQQLDAGFFWRDGLCYALTRECIMAHASIITQNTRPLVTPRPVVNIDEPLELEWAEFLMQREAALDQSDGAL